MKVCVKWREGEKEREEESNFIRRNGERETRRERKREEVSERT